ncbi:MAG: ECF-type sigma factor [Lysobacterales bacterium]|jgi:RNA polymerase sigma factor (TIGR02999 family)
MEREQSLQPITQWLHSAHGGDDEALNELYNAVYPVLYRMAASKPGVAKNATVTPTVVISELFLKITDSEVLDSNDRQHFFATCSRAMRFIVTDFARIALSQKRGGDVDHCAYTTQLAKQPDRAQQLVDIDAALNELELIDPRLRELVELKFFGGLTYSEIGELHDRSERSIKRDWVKARAFLVARAGNSMA